MLMEGIDPTAPDIHLGHTVVLQMRGVPGRRHTVVLIIGDFTARVGRPSGRPRCARCWSPRRSTATRTFQEQAFKVLDDAPRCAATASGSTCRWRTCCRCADSDARARARAGRLHPADAEGGADLDARAALPVLQGYDSVAVQADVELGGTDQKFNLLFGRDVQQAYGQEPQAILTMPILPGLDGRRRMSKSLRQLHRGDGAAGGDVRQADERPGRRDGDLLRAAGATTSIPRGADQSAPSAAAGGPVPRRRRCARRPPTFDRVHRTGTSRPRGRGGRPPRARAARRRCTCRPAGRRTSGLRAARPAAAVGASPRRRWALASRSTRATLPATEGPAGRADAAAPAKRRSRRPGGA